MENNSKYEPQKTENVKNLGENERALQLSTFVTKYSNRLKFRLSKNSRYLHEESTIDDWINDTFSVPIKAWIFHLEFMVLFQYVIIGFVKEEKQQSSNSKKDITRQ